MKTINYLKEMSLGMGFDSVTGKVRGQAIEYDGVQNAPGAGSGQERTSYLKMIETQESFIEELEISSEIEAGYGIFSGSAKMKLAQNNSVHEYSLHILAKSSVKNPPLTMVNPRLKPKARECYQNDPEEFRRLYGDCYIERVIGGGEYFGLYTFHTKDSTSQQSLKASLNVSIGSFLTGGVDAKLDLSSATSSQNSEITTEVLEIVSGGDEANKTTAEGIIASYRNFPSEITTAPVNHKVYVKEYLELLPQGPGWLEQQARKDTIQTCGQNYMEGVQLRNKIWYILDHQDQFSLDYDFINLQNTLEELNVRLTEWLDLARNCRDNISECDPGAIQPAPVITWPKRVQAFDPLQEKWDEIQNHWEPKYLRYFKQDYHPSEHPDHKSNMDWKCYTHNEGRYWIFYQELNNGKYKPISGIFSHPENGTHAVWGSIFTAYFKQGHCQGVLGYPKTDEEYISGSDGDRINIFEKGLLWWDKQSGKVSDKSPVDIHAYINPNIVTMVNLISHPKP